MIEAEGEAATIRGLGVAGRRVAEEEAHLFDDPPLDGAVAAIEAEGERLAIQHFLVRRARDERLQLLGRRRRERPRVVVADLRDALRRDDDRCTRGAGVGCGRAPGGAARRRVQRGQDRPEHEEMQRRETGSCADDAADRSRHYRDARSFPRVAFQRRLSVRS